MTQHGEAPEPFISIHDDAIHIRRSYAEGYHNGRLLAWLLDVREEALLYYRDEGGIGWFTVPREEVDLDWLALRVKALFLQVETKCHHTPNICPIHNVDTRWRDEASRERFDF